MRRTAVEVLAAAVLLTAGFAAWGQQPGGAREEAGRPAPPAQKEDAAAKSKLEEMLLEALRNNPDIRVAAAKVSEAEAELNRTRLLVAQKVIALHHQIESQRAEVKYQQARSARARNLAGGRGISKEELDEVQQALTLAKAKLAGLEAEVPYLTGKPVEQVPPAKKAGRTERAAAQLANRAMAEKIRRALDQEVKVQYKNELTGVVLKELLGKIEGVPHRIVVNTPGRVTLEFEKPISLGAALQALQDDREGDWSILVREYGILVSSPPLLPPNAITLESFWKSGPAPGGAEGKPERVAINPPPEQVEGLVKKVDRKTGLVRLTIGSDAGLAKGHTLEVYRLKPQPKYLGTVRVINVTAHEAVAQAFGRLAGAIQEGDRVASKLGGQ